MANLSAPQSRVQLMGAHSGGHCGYCDGNGSAVYGMTASTLTVAAYQALVDRGWRRAGTFLYKPNLRASCCPQYTIRLEAARFAPNKRQRRALAKFRRLTAPAAPPPPPPPPPSQADALSAALAAAVERAVAAGALPAGLDVAALEVAAVPSRKRARRAAVGDFSSAVARRVAAQTGDAVTAAAAAAAIAAHAELPAGARCEATATGWVNLWVSAAAAAAAEEAPRAPEQQERFTFEMRPAEVTDEVHRLYKRYQMRVHGDPAKKCTKKAFKEFLVDSPLVGNAEQGTFHQLYRVDGRLVAVGVVDVLPLCLSSVYVFYDPDAPALSLGVVSALREIEWVQQQQSPMLRYYYLGYYIATCPKMRYKGDYAPADLLCPETYRWVPLADVRQRIDDERYARLAAADVAAAADQPATPAQIAAVPLFVGTPRLASVTQLQDGPTRLAIEAELASFVQFVGPRVAARTAVDLVGGEGGGGESESDYDDNI